MKNIIKITESDIVKIVKKVLSEQKPDSAMPGQPDNPANRNINPRNLKLGAGGVKNPNQVQAVKELQQKLINSGFLKLNSGKPTGYYGNLTQAALNAYNGKKTQDALTGFYDKKRPAATQKQQPINKGQAPVAQKKQSTINAPCVGLDKNMCSKIDSNKIIELGSGEESQCAAYVKKCLSQYDKELYVGNAWQANSMLTGQGYGPEKYNMFRSNEINWDNIWTNLKKNKVTLDTCNDFIGKAHSDRFTINGQKRNLLKLINDSIPEKSGVNISQLRPGDIVGLWHTNTENKGRAFCERMKEDLKLDMKGNFKQLPFTFNTHVGFVTAIKNGVPIVAHNVNGTYYAAPATQLLGKNSGDMIVWVLGDPNITNTAVQKKSK